MNTFKAKTILNNPTSFMINLDDHKKAFNILHDIAFKTGQAFKLGTASCISKTTKYSADDLARIMLVNKANKFLNGGV